MPELPEVETVRRGIRPSVVRKRIKSVRVNNPNLRLRIPSSFARKLAGRTVLEVDRRAKYLILRLDEGNVLVHLGMSGTLRISKQEGLPLKHDHVVIDLTGGGRIVYNDPRRFGLIAWTEDVRSHRLISGLGIEPLSKKFDGKPLFDALQRRHTSVKNAIMNSRLLAGVGNIYANEALHLSGISPLRISGSLSEDECTRLARAIKGCLRAAIKAGGSTLRNFTNADGRPGYFQLRYGVYGRDGQNCRTCEKPVKRVVQAGRATFYCPLCQT